jgi:putative transposase
MRAHVREFRLVAMCRVLGVQRSGYYAWLRHGASAREREDQRLLELIKHHWLASGTVYGYRKITLDLREAGEHCSRHRVLRLMKAEGLRAQVGYGSKPRHRGGPAGVVANVLNRDFTPQAPNKVWVTDITYIRTYEGWLFLAAVMDLYSRQIAGWATAPTMTSDLVLQALVAAAWRRKPGPGVMVHSDQGCQFTSSYWQSFLKAHRMVPSMSRRGNCHERAACPRGTMPWPRVFQRLEEGADQAADLPDTRHGGIGRVRLHRDVLQPDPPAWFRWRTVTGRV